MVDPNECMYRNRSDIFNEQTNLTNYNRSKTSHKSEKLLYRGLISIQAFSGSTQEFFLVPLSPSCIMKMVKPLDCQKITFKFVLQISVVKIYTNTKELEISRGRIKQTAPESTVSYV